MINFFELTLVDSLKIYERVILSLLLIIINAIVIRETTRPPATKLEIKFANEVVISDYI